MDATSFDTLSKTLTDTMTRRTAMRGLLAGALAAVVGVSAVHENADARRRKGGKRKKQKTRKLQPGDRCEFTSQCQQGYICEVPVNGSNSDTYCSGGQGAICGAPNGDGDDTFPFCAVGFDCVLTGGAYRCQAVPDEL